MSRKIDFEARLKRARRRRNRKDNKLLYLGIGIVVLIILITIITLFLRKRPVGDKKADFVATASEAVLTDEAKLDPIAAMQEEESARINEVIASYKDLAIVNTSLLNMRDKPDTSGAKIARLYKDSAVDILDRSNSEWFLVKSNGLEGYVASQYLTQSEEAKNSALSLVKKRAKVLKDSLRVRTEPDTTKDNVVDIVYIDDKLEVVSEEGDWIKTTKGYVARYNEDKTEEYLLVDFSLDEANKLSEKDKVINKYNNRLIVSKADNYINIRSKADEKSEIIGKFPGKAAGEIIEKEGSWYKIKSGPLTGYVTADENLVSIGAEAEDIAIRNAKLMVTVNGAGVRVREKPSAEQGVKIWAELSNQEKFPVVNELDEWVEIELEEENKAFINKNYVTVGYALNEAIKFSPLEEKVNQSSSRRAKIVNFALQYLGNPYVWGGTSLTRGADCSGFTMKVLGNFGVSLPHYSVAQSKLGQKITSEQMRPGDLIFYSNSRGTINHVSMYIGNGQVVHAASRRSGIKISSWNYRRPVAIRNVLGD